MGQKLALRIAQLTFGILGVLGGLYGGSFLYEHFIVHAGWSEQIKLAAVIIPAVILGVVGMLVMTDFPAADPLTAAAVGIVSGLAATGVDQISKQMKD